MKLTAAQKRIWENRIAIKNNSTAPKLESLPPTDLVFQENLKQAHIQIAIWRNSLNSDPLHVKIIDYGWSKDPSSACLLHNYGPVGSVMVPDVVLKVTHCSYHKLNVSCTTFCECERTLYCQNLRTPRHGKKFFD